MRMPEPEQWKLIGEALVTWGIWIIIYGIITIFIGLVIIFIANAMSNKSVEFIK